MEKKEANALARRINTENKRVHAIASLRVGGQGEYIVVVKFRSGAALGIEGEHQWEFLKQLRVMDDEERRLIQELKAEEERVQEEIAVWDEVLSKIAWGGRRQGIISWAEREPLRNGITWEQLEEAGLYGRRGKSATGD